MISRDCAKQLRYARNCLFPRLISYKTRLFHLRVEVGERAK